MWEKIRIMNKEMKRGIRKQGKWLRKEVEVTRKFLKREGLWRKEREELKNCVKDKVCDKCDKVREVLRDSWRRIKKCIKKRIKSARGRPGSRRCRK